MQAIVYKARAAYRLTDKQAEVVGPELTRILNEHDGSLLPRDVVEAAADEASPLHEHFEWSDTEAAYLYRCEQARYLIRAVVMVVETEEKSVTAPAFYHVIPPVDGRSCYATAARVFSEPDLAAQVLAQALRDIRSVKAKYAEVKEIASVIQAINKLEEELAAQAEHDAA